MALASGQTKIKREVASRVPEDVEERGEFMRHHRWEPRGRRLWSTVIILTTCDPDLSVVMNSVSCLVVGFFC